LRILADENISPVVVAALEADGHDVLAVADAMRAASPEGRIARAAFGAKLALTQ
jgi:hypothetical protein